MSHDGQYDSVPRILSRQHCTDGEPLRQERRHIFAAVDGKVDLAAQQRVLDFLHEQPLAADFGERRVLQTIARSLQDDNAAGRTAAGGNARRHRIGLPKRELTPAGAESKFLIHGNQRCGRDRFWGNGSTLLRRDSAAGSSRTAEDSVRSNRRVRASAYTSTLSESPRAFNCSVGVSSSFSIIRWVISSTRARASGGNADSLNSSRSSSARRMTSKRCRNATTVGMALRDRSHAANLSTSSPTIASARATSLERRARFSRTVACRSSML